MARISVQEAGGINVLAFIDLVGDSEIGEEMLAIPETDDGYKVLVGSRTGHLMLFQDYSRHPHILNHDLDSTAAGRAQIIYPTWAPIQQDYELPDFGPLSQDRATVVLLTQRHALARIVAGDISQAIYLCREEWASFPGGDSGQHQNQMNTLLGQYAKCRARYA